MRDYKLTLNLITNDSVPCKTFKQYDSGNEIELELYENEHLKEDKKVTLANEKVLAFFQQENGTVIQKNATIKNGNIFIATTSDVLGVPGSLLLECVIINGDEKTTTQTLQFTVNKSIDRNEAVKELPQWDIIDALTKAAETEQDRLKGEETRKVDELDRKVSEIDRKTSEEERKAKYGQIQEQWRNVSTAVKDSNIGQSVVTEVIAARTNKQAKSYNTLGERIDNIEDKVQSRDYTEIETLGASLVSLPNAVEGQGKITEIQGNTLVNLLDKNMFNSIFTKDINCKLHGNFSFKYAPVNSGNWSEFPNLHLNPSHKYYLRGEVYISSYTNGAVMGIQITDTGTWNNLKSKAANTTLLNVWQMNSILVSGRGDTKVTFGSGGFGTNIVNYDGIITIDLTSSFGEGKEPSIEWCDANLKYFEGMKSVDKIEVLSGNVNAFDGSNIIPNLTLSYGNSTKPTWSNNAIVRNASGEAQWVYNLKLKPNTTYKISSVRTDGMIIYIGAWANTTYTTSSSGILQIIVYFGVNTTSSSSINNIQIEEGSISSTYIPYQEDKINILSGDDLKGLPNGTRDTVSGDTKTIKIGKMILNGSESWEDNGNDSLYKLFYVDLNFIKKSTPILSSSFETGININGFVDKEEGIVNSYNVFYFSILKSRLATPGVDGFKAYLQANPITIQYQLAEPIIEKLPKPLTLSSFENGSMVINSNIPCNVTYAYPTNLSSAVSSLRDYTEVLEGQITGLWKTALGLADRELRMKSIPLQATETNLDIKNKINEILNIWR